MVPFFLLASTGCLSPSEPPAEAENTAPPAQESEGPGFDVDALLHYQDWRRQQASILDVMSIYLPEHAQIRSLTLEDQRMSLTGWAARIDSILHFQEELKQFGYVPRLEALSIEKIEVDRETLYRFAFTGDVVLPTDTDPTDTDPTDTDGSPVMDRQAFFEEVPATSGREIMERILRRSQEHELTIQQLHQGGELAYRDGISVHPFTLVVQGRFHDLVMFLNIISRQQGPVQQDRLQVDIVRDDSNGTVISATIALWFFAGSAPPLEAEVQQRIKDDGFNPMGKVDPFNSILDPPILYDHPTSVLRRYEPEDYRLSAILEDGATDSALALLAAPEGRSDILRVGESFGRSSRRIDRISPDHIDWTEADVDFDGNQTEQSGQTNIYGTNLSTTPFSIDSSTESSDRLMGLRSHQADIHGLFRLISAHSGINLVVGHGIDHNVSVQLDQLPARRLLALLASAHGLHILERSGTVQISQAPMISNRISGYSDTTAVSIDFHRAEISAIMKLFRHVSGRNIIWSEDISGEVSLLLNEMPWDQALGAIADVSGLEVMWEADAIVVKKRAP